MEIDKIKINILSILSSTQKFKEAADFAEFELKDSKLAVEYCIKAQDYVHALYLAQSRSILDRDLGIKYKNVIIFMTHFILIKYILILYIFFPENLIKLACLNTAQNLISDINAQSENFVVLEKRLVEVRTENSNESVSYGIVLQKCVTS